MKKIKMKMKMTRKRTGTPEKRSITGFPEDTALSTPSLAKTKRKVRVIAKTKGKVSQDRKEGQGLASQVRSGDPKNQHVHGQRTKMSTFQNQHVPSQRTNMSTF